MKKILLLALLVMAGNFVFAQVDSVRLQLDKIFQYIDKTQVPTGYLNEYCPEVVNKISLNGVLTDSISTIWCRAL